MDKAEKTTDEVKIDEVEIDEVKMPDLKIGTRYFFTTTREPKKRFKGIYTGKFFEAYLFKEVETYELKEVKLDNEPTVKIIGTNNTNNTNNTKYNFFKLNFKGLPDDMDRNISEYIGGANKRQSKHRNNKSKRRNNKSKRRNNRK